MISIIIITKGHIFVILLVELQFLFSAHCLIMIYICTKFGESILKSLRVMEQTRFQYLLFQRGIIP